MIGRREIAFVAIAATLACTPGTSGPMVPLAATGIELTKDARGAPAARVAAAAVSLVVSGRWTNRGPQQLTIAYTNAGTQPATIAVATMSLARGTEQAPLLTVTDVSGADRANYDPDVQTTTLAEADQPRSARPLIVTPGATRTITVDFGPMPSDAPIDRGQRLTARIATARGATTILFDTKADGWF